jgi:hypothetical protein
MKRILAWCGVALLAGARLPAQELSILGGTTTSGAFDHSTYGWEVDYRQDL